MTTMEMTTIHGNGMSKCSMPDAAILCFYQQEGFKVHSTCSCLNYSFFVFHICSLERNLVNKYCLARKSFITSILLKGRAHQSSSRLMKIRLDERPVGASYLFQMTKIGLEKGDQNERQGEFGPLFSSFEKDVIVNSSP